MSMVTLTETATSLDVVEFLKRHDAELAFEKLHELVRETFPELVQMKSWLQEDPDVDGHRWVMIYVFMPSAHPLELLRRQRHAFYDQLPNRLPRSAGLPIFSLVLDFASE